MKYLFQATNAKRKLENIKATNKAKITIKLINNIDRELYIPSNDGSKSGYLTAKGENILHNFLFTYGYNQKDIENIFTTD